MTSMPYETRHPILLDGRHPLVRLFLDEQHCANHDEGIEYLRSVISQRFWILRLRSVLHSLKISCNVCRRFAPSVVQPEMANLPPERLGDRKHPFTYVGVDYFGPVTVTVKRRSEKRWCFLFTCLTVRAVHIEVCCQYVYRLLPHGHLSLRCTPGQTTRHSVGQRHQLRGCGPRIA